MSDDTNLEDVQQIGRDFLEEMYSPHNAPMIVVNRMNALIRLAHIIGQREVLIKETKSIFPWIN
jgi:hypothetical protein